LVVIEMFAKIKTKLAKKRAQSFLNNVYAWYQTCEEVSDVIEDALHDQSIITKDIGYIVDHADRKLFHLRYYIPEPLSTLRRRNPELARRFDLACQQIYHLRNETTSFLIRSQGPGPLSGEEPDEGTRLIYYYRALEEVGFKARDMKKDLDREIKCIWRELQNIILQEEMVVNYAA
jgi:hypothetical protein